MRNNFLTEINKETWKNSKRFISFSWFCYNNQHKMFSPYLESSIFFENSCIQSKPQIMSKNWKQPIKYWNSSSKSFSKFYSKICIYTNSGLTFLDRIRKIWNSKYKFDLFKRNDCFVDGYDSVNSERNNFSIQFWLFLQTNLVKFFLFSFQMLFSDKMYVIFFYKVQKISLFRTDLRIFENFLQDATFFIF